MKNVMSFDQFLKHTPAHEEVKGEHEIVKAHYSEGDQKDLHEQDPKHPGVKGDGKADHTEAVKRKDLSDPKTW